MHNTKIMNGDSVRFIFSNDTHVDAVVLGVPQNTREYWIVEENNRIVYINPCHPNLSFVVKLEEEE